MNVAQLGALAGVVLAGCHTPPAATSNPALRPVEAASPSRARTGATLSPWTLVGTTAGEELGGAVAGVGDIDADGYGDIVVARPGGGAAGEGTLALHLGGAAGPAPAASWTDSGGQAGARLGAAVVGAGDWNGDGYADLLAGAPGWDGTLTDEGQVRLYLGGAAGLSASWQETGGQAGAALGSALAGAGDVDGAPGAEVAAGAPSWDGSVLDGGRVLTWLGGPGGDAVPDVTIEGSVTGARLGVALALLPSWDGDGFADLAVGASGPDEAGWVEIHSGTASGPLPTASWLLLGESPGDALGTALASAGDVDGDGLSDLLIGSPGEDGAAVDGGGLHLVLGSPGAPPQAPSWSVLGLTPGGGLGASVSGAGDSDGDGFADILAGEPGGSSFFLGEGLVHLWFGAAGGLGGDPDWTATGGAPGTSLGAAVAASDVDGDGRSDVFAGAPGWDPGAAPAAGRVLSWPGEPDLPQAEPVWELPGTELNANLGYSLSAGDCDSDGFDDVLIGAWHADPTLNDEGQVLLHLGTNDGPSPVPTWTASGGQAGAALGTSVAFVGDWDGDGYADLAAGAPGFDNGQSGEGLVRLWACSATGPATLLLEAEGGVAGASLGGALAGGADVQGDGRTDLVAGARLHPGAGSQRGAVHLWSALDGTAPVWVAEGPTDGDQLGSSVELGDVTGDGYADVVAGAPHPNNGFGSVVLWAGGPSGPALSPTWSATGLFDEELGRGVAIPGDLDGDGFFDLAVGAPAGALGGRVLVFPGTAAGPGPAASTLSSPDPAANFGAALAGAGDLDGDGVPELLVGGAGASVDVAGGGAAWLWLGGALPLPASPDATWVGGQANAGLGRALVSGDFDGDGSPDVALGAWQWDAAAAGSGTVRIHRGGGGSSHPGPSALHLRDAATGAPVAPGGLAQGPVRVVGVAGSPLGSDEARLEAEILSPGQPWSSALRVDGPWAPALGAGQPGPVQVDAPTLAAGSPFALRVRARWSAEDNVTTLFGPWRHLVARPIPGAPAFRTACALDLDADLLCDPIDPDDDGDGTIDGADCGPLDPALHPGAAEIPGDGIDQDCDGWDARICWLDEDGDSAGSGASFTDPAGCVGPGQADAGGDCDDSRPTVHPGAAEACDGLDTNCFLGDELSTESDGDGDGFLPCEPFVSDSPVFAGGGDCDDTAGTIFPGAVESVLDCADSDCNGTIPPAEVSDGDWDGQLFCQGDCNDANPLVRGGWVEWCDGLDNDCDLDLPTEEEDADGDGFRICLGDCDDGDAGTYPGAPELDSATADRNCDGAFGADADRDGFGVEAGDCDDGDVLVFPGAPELCDGVDQNCDGAPGAAELVDADGDGQSPCAGDCADGDPTRFLGAPEACDGWDSDCDGRVGAEGDWDADRDGVPVCAGDCDDDNDAVRPGRGEVCGGGQDNGLDDDCDGSVDADTDADGDGATSCGQDCDDGDAGRTPGAPEDCDGIDDDCDGDIDEDYDADGDGFSPCFAPVDCDDADASTFPGALATCTDGLDNDCLPAGADGIGDEWVDGDGDGAPGCPSPGDCAEADPQVGPGRPELCDGRDNDCDGEVDEGLDLDGDGLAPCSGDCAEGEALTRAGLPEVCDGVDNDCDGILDPTNCEGPPTVDLVIVLPRGCSCQQGDPTAAPPGLALLALLRRRRRDGAA